MLMLVNNKTSNMQLPKPAIYFPPENGRYEVKTGFHTLTQDFGNGKTDLQIFQFDSLFDQYRGNKLLCRNERLAKYYQTDAYRPDTCFAVNQYLINQLLKEHSDKFSWRRGNNHTELCCHLTDETLCFDKDNQLLPSCSTSRQNYVSSLDAIANQVQEDLAVVQLGASQYNRLCALHLCSPNHWSAEDKIGKDFTAIHEPVPHMEKINSRALSLLDAVIEKGPFVRFAWGLATDCRLNHHPHPPNDTDAQEWHGRHFELTEPRLYMRVERQTLNGLKDVNAIIFTIRTYHYDVQDIVCEQNQRLALSSAIQSMSSESLLYKGLMADKEKILTWLASL